MSETQHAALDVPKFVPANFGADPPPELVKKQRKPLTKWKPGERPVGRAKGTPNKVTQTLREAVEIAARECHPQGLAGWLVDRAQGGIQDRQIFAGLVGKVIPMQVHTSVQGGISINLGWLAQRGIGTPAAQPVIEAVQVVDAIEHSPSGNWTTDGTQGAQPVQASEARPVQPEADPPSPVDPGTPPGA